MKTNESSHPESEQIPTKAEKNTPNTGRRLDYTKYLQSHTSPDYSHNGHQAFA